MAQRTFFDADDDAPPPLAARLAPKLRALAEHGVYFGTSSWKYEGWLGSIYRREKYSTRGKFSKKRFEDACLAEYVRTFPTVCGDFAFYQFPSKAYWDDLFGKTPESFAFAFKVPEDITVIRWPKHPRYGERAGQDNDSFLNAELLEEHFLGPLEPHSGRVATLIFEFGTFAQRDFAIPDDFFRRLDDFLGSIPKGWRYSVEIRNADYLTPPYLGVLERHGVAHVLNAWTRMPTLADQSSIPDVWTADFTVVRALLAKGRKYEDAVRVFSPYEKVQEPDEESRDALRQIAEDARRSRKDAYIYINNRFEGNSPGTIEAVADAIDL